jgi:hypothetical protein
MAAATALFGSGQNSGSGLCLLDHLVGTVEKGCRNLDAEQFRCL